MPRFAANLSMLFTERPFLERFTAAADHGFRGVEFQFPYAETPEPVARAAAAAGVEVVLFNLPPGDWAAGERGLGALPGRETRLEAGFAQALEYAGAMGCRRLHVMAGAGPSAVGERVYLSTLVSNLKRMAPRAQEAGVTLLVEPINNRDMPGYVLNHIDQGLEVVDAVGHPAIRLQFDFYHRQIMRGDLTTALDAAFPVIAHVQIANVPGRREPDRGEIDYRTILRRLDALGYDGWVGCEYRPSDPADTAATLGWRDAYGGDAYGGDAYGGDTYASDADAEEPDG